ncbi:MAG: FAD-binding protein [Nannocystales bacterium]
MPRWHITWGSGFEIVIEIVAAIESHPNRGRLQLQFEHAVSELLIESGRAVGFCGQDTVSGEAFRATAEHVVVASRGICGGNLDTLRENWFKPWGEAPGEHLLFGNRKLVSVLPRCAPKTSWSPTPSTNSSVP